MFRGSYYFVFALIGVMLLGLMLGGEPNKVKEEQAKLLPEPLIRLSDINQIELKSPGASVTLENTEGDWQVLDRWNYPADQEKVRGFLRQLLSAEKLERKTRKPENFSRLGVDDNATRVTVAGAEPFWLGKSNEGGRSGHFVRIGDDGVWLVSGQFSDVDANPASWLAPEIINIDPSELREVVVSHEREFLKAVVDEGSVYLDGIPAEQMRYAGIADSLQRVLTGVRMIDVVPANEFEALSASALTATLVDGSKVDVRVLAQDGKYWLIRPGGDWVYEISSGTYDTMTKTSADFIRQQDDQR